MVDFTYKGAALSFASFFGLSREVRPPAPVVAKPAARVQPALAMPQAPPKPPRRPAAFSEASDGLDAAGEDEAAQDGWLAAQYRTMRIFADKAAAGQLDLACRLAFNTTRGSADIIAELEALALDARSSKPSPLTVAMAPHAGRDIGPDVLPAATGEVGIAAGWNNAVDRARGLPPRQAARSPLAASAAPIFAPPASPALRQQTLPGEPAFMAESRRRAEAEAAAHYARTGEATA